MTPDKEPNKGGSRLQKPGGQAPAPRKPRLTSRQKVLRVVYVLVTVLALLVVAVFAASRLLFVKPTVPTTPDIPNLPAVSGSPTFSDVAPGAYYAKAVQWAETKGITGGIGGGLFGSDNDCTRAQIVTFIYRYMEK